MPIVAALAALALVDQNIFDQSIAAFRARKAFSVSVSLEATLSKKVTSARFDVSYQAPDKVLVTQFIAGKPAYNFWLNGAKFIAYDPAVKEMVVRKASRTGSIADRIASEIGSIEDPVKAQISPEVMAEYVNRYKKVQGWVTQTRNGEIILTRSATVNKAKTFAELDFSMSSKLLTRTLLVGTNSRLEWGFTYHDAPKALSFRPARDAKRVTALSEHIHIDASDAKARQLVDESLRSYARLTSIDYTVTGPEGVSENRMQGSAFAARQGRIEWSYRSGIFTLKDSRSKKVFQGSCRPNSVLSYLKAANSPMDPVLLSLFSQRNPIRGWLIQGMVATSRGTVNLGGIPAHAIELRSPRNEVSMLIRGDNHLVSSVSSRIKDPAGKLVSDTHREFSYSSVNKPVPATAFVIPASTFLPLSKIGKP